MQQLSPKLNQCKQTKVRVQALGYHYWCKLVV